MIGAAMDESIFDRWKKDPRPTEELIRLAIAEQDEERKWELITVLHFRATREVLEAAEGLCASGEPGERQLGANILGQLGPRESAFPNERFECLSRTLEGEADADVIQGIAIAFGHLNDPRAIPLLLPFVEHPDSDVRWGVVHGMSTHSDGRAIHALIRLSNDNDDEIRNWAIFGLGTLTDYDSPDLRNALVERLNDPYVEARLEALVGLARRKDNRALDPLLESLSAKEVDELALEAAQELANPQLVPALLELKRKWAGDNDRLVADLDSAIAACQQSVIP
jgi:HEAT repeat protein